MVEDRAIKTLALRRKLGPHVIESFGLDELVDVSYRVLPDAVKRAFVNAQGVNLDLKMAAGRKVYAAASVGAAGIGAIPIPIPDAVPLTALQATMMARIAVVMGVDLNHETVEFLLKRVLGVGSNGRHRPAGSEHAPEVRAGFRKRGQRGRRRSAHGSARRGVRRSSAPKSSDARRRARRCPTPRCSTSSSTPSRRRTRRSRASSRGPAMLGSRCWFAEKSGRPGLPRRASASRRSRKRPPYHAKRVTTAHTRGADDWSRQQQRPWRSS